MTLVEAVDTEALLASRIRERAEQSARDKAAAAENKEVEEKRKRRENAVQARLYAEFAEPEPVASSAALPPRMSRTSRTNPLRDFWS